VTITVLGPAAKITVAVPDPPGERVMVDGETVPELLESWIVPEKPFRLLTVTENEHDPLRPPIVQVVLPGAITLKSCTMNFTVTECDREPEVPVTVAV
jgi:hypothetical protein